MPFSQWRSTVLAALVLSTGALAQTTIPSFELERIHLNPGGESSLVNSTGDLNPEGDLRISAAAQYANGTRILADTGSGQVDVSDRLTVHIMGSFTVRKWLQIYGELPVIAYQRGDSLQVAGFNKLFPSGFGTPELGARFGLVRESDGGPLNLALEVSAGLPIGNSAALGHDQAVAFAPKLSLGKTLSSVYLGGEIGAYIRPIRHLSANPADTVDDEGRLGLTGALNFSNTFRAELDLRGALGLTQGRAGGEALLGFRYNVDPRLELFALFGPGFGDLVGTPVFRVFIGGAFNEPMRKDLGTESAVAGGSHPVQVEQTVPAAVVCDANRPHQPQECPDLDDDQDGIANRADMCPLQPEDKDHYQDEDGCPDPDNDGDGTLDAKDQCPNEAGPSDNHGCPLKDADKDGIVDDQDRCPAEAGPSSNGGCPVKDADADGIPDDRDNCPHEKGDAANQGCPAAKKQLVIITDKKLEISQKVYFASRKANLLAKSYKLLNNVADVINDHPAITKIYIDGFTDDRGKPESNLTLSQARAEAVREYLVSKGVGADRMVAKGFGSACPVSSNSTAIGRESNRRVEFNLTEATRCSQDTTSNTNLTPLTPPVPATGSATSAPASSAAASSSTGAAPAASGATSTTASSTTEPRKGHKRSKKTKTVGTSATAAAPADPGSQRWIDANPSADAAASKTGKKSKKHTGGAKAPTPIK